MTAVLWAAMVRVARHRGAALPAAAGGRRAHAARGGELPRALRHAAPARRATATTSAGSASTRSHSWNSNNIATNVLLYHLQRHSDHHANPTRRYQALRDYAESPVLPTGYAGMILLALVPPAWRRVMDPRVLRARRRRPDPRQPRPAHGARRCSRATAHRAAPAAASVAVPRRRRRAPARRRGRGVPLPGLRLPLRRGARATRARASRRARRGRPCPTRGAARTAACATRSTSWSSGWCAA